MADADILAALNPNQSIWPRYDNPVLNALIGQGSVTPGPDAVGREFWKHANDGTLAPYAQGAGLNALNGPLFGQLPRVVGTGTRILVGGDGEAARAATQQALDNAARSDPATSLAANVAGGAALAPAVGAGYGAASRLASKGIAALPEGAAEAIQPIINHPVTAPLAAGGVGAGLDAYLNPDGSLADHAKQGALSAVSAALLGRVPTLAEGLWSDMGQGNVISRALRGLPSPAAAEAEFQNRMRQIGMAPFRGMRPISSQGSLAGIEPTSPLPGPRIQPGVPAEDGNPLTTSPGAPGATEPPPLRPVGPETRTEPPATQSGPASSDLLKALFSEPERAPTPPDSRSDTGTDRSWQAYPAPQPSMPPTPILRNPGGQEPAGPIDNQLDAGTDQMPPKPAKPGKVETPRFTQDLRKPIVEALIGKLNTGAEDIPANIKRAFSDPALQQYSPKAVEGMRSGIEKMAINRTSPQDLADALRTGLHQNVKWAVAAPVAAALFGNSQPQPDPVAAALADRR